MTAHRRDPYRRVVQAKLLEKPRRWWSLKLECGHDDVRPVKYRLEGRGPRGGNRRAGHVRPVSDVLMAPQKIRCDQCV